LDGGYQKSESREQEAKRRVKMRVGGKFLRAKMAAYGGERKTKDYAENTEDTEFAEKRMARERKGFITEVAEGPQRKRRD